MKFKALEKLTELESNPEFADKINTFYKHLSEAKSHNQALNVIVTGGVTNKNILKVQSRIGKTLQRIVLKI